MLLLILTAYADPVTVYLLCCWDAFGDRDRMVIMVGNLCACLLMIEVPFLLVVDWCDVYDDGCFSNDCGY